MQYEFQVAMTCEGCAKAVRTLVSKVPGMLFACTLASRCRGGAEDLTFFWVQLGVEEVNIDVAKKQVLVKGTASSDDLLAAIKKTGKETTLVSS